MMTMIIFFSEVDESETDSEIHEEENEDTEE